jgi:hypothetical protein
MVDLKKTQEFVTSLYGGMSQKKPNTQNPNECTTNLSGDEKKITT